MQHRISQYLSIVVSTFSVGASLLTFGVLHRGLKDSAAVGAAMRAAARAAWEWQPVATLVPARDEEANIGACVASILAQDYPAIAVIAIDDDSTDRTSAILADLRRRHPDQLRVLRVRTAPPRGWAGKTHALWHGYAHVPPEIPWLLFIDADVTLKPGALRAAVAYAQAQRLDLLSLVPAPRMRDFWSRLLVPTVARFYLLAQVDPLRPARRGSPEQAGAIGQFILVRHDAYRAVGGHLAVRGSTAEDVALAKRFREHGFTTLMINALDFAEADTYRGLGELWEGASKNLFVVARGRWSTMMTVLALEWLSGLIPAALLALPRRTQGRVSVWVNRVAVGLLALSYGRYLRVVNVPLRYVALYPLSALLASLVFFDSARKVRLRGSVEWKGRAVDMRPLFS
jgi:chlorobactene glucosyltransferase